MTLVFYVQAEDAPPLEILTDEMEVEASITPVEGMVALVRNGVYHQVPKNRGPVDRMALIVEAYP